LDWNAEFDGAANNYAMTGGGGDNKNFLCGH